MIDVAIIIGSTRPGRKGEAYVFVTPEYNHSAPGPLKNAIDFLPAGPGHRLGAALKVLRRGANPPSGSHVYGGNIGTIRRRSYDPRHRRSPLVRLRLDSPDYVPRVRSNR